MFSKVFLIRYDRYGLWHTAARISGWTSGASAPEKELLAVCFGEHGVVMDMEEVGAGENAGEEVFGIDDGDAWGVVGEHAGGDGIGCFFGGGGHQYLVLDHGGESLAGGYAVADPGEDVGA